TENPLHESDTSQPGPATLMGRLMRQELHRQNRGGPLAHLFNQPWVVVPLFLLCVGIILWSLLRPTPEPETAAAESDTITLGDRLNLQRSLTAAKTRGAYSAAQRFYQRGLELLQHGEVEGARRIWTNTVRSFEGIAAEERWVRLAAEGLVELNHQLPPQRDPAVREALQRARQLRDQGKRTEAEAIWSGLEFLYAGDPTADSLRQEVRRERAP
ncbi:MAG: hypothetical protein L0Z62_24235, partial [Gemmataceae bacterium]|nr:hypothetical protein [Gemmataceae bacterium]